jgi:hypothetical protein
MTVKNIVIIVVVLIIAGITAFLSYIGLFGKVTIEEKEMGPFVLVYEEHKGDYRGTAKIQDDIYNSLLKDYEIETFKGFGIYYDKPGEVPTDELRSIAGCILEESDYDKIDFLEEKEFNIREIPGQDSIVAEFPFKNKFSIFVGIMKVYPKIEDYIKEHNLANNEMMEIYDIPSKKIIYLMNK